MHNIPKKQHANLLSIIDYTINDMNGDPSIVNNAMDFRRYYIDLLKQPSLTEQICSEIDSVAVETGSTYDHELPKNSIKRLEEAHPRSDWDQVKGALLIEQESSNNRDNVAFNAGYVSGLIYILKKLEGKK